MEMRFLQLTMLRVQLKVNKKLISLMKMEMLFLHLTTQRRNVMEKESACQLELNSTRLKLKDGPMKP
jgi:hypothetical protein